jgi:hypothetical protein
LPMNKRLVSAEAESELIVTTTVVRRVTKYFIDCSFLLSNLMTLIARIKANGIQVHALKSAEKLC